MRSLKDPWRWLMRNQIADWDGLRHCVAGCDDLYRRCVIGKETLESWARRNNYDWVQVRACWLMVSKVKPPSIERRAAILMRDWGLEDEDISEMLALPEERVRWVRANIRAVRNNERIPLDLEMAVAQIDEDDLPPDELWAKAKELRDARPTVGFIGAMRGDVHRSDPRSDGIRAYSWSKSRRAFLSTST